MSRLTDSKLGEITQRLVRELDPHQIWLFGYHAWGQPDEDSDVDLLVIVDRSDEPEYRLAQRAYRALYGVRFPCDVIVHTRHRRWNEPNRSRFRCCARSWKTGAYCMADAKTEEPDSPWVGCLGHGPLLRPVYLDGVLREAERRQPDHPLLAVFLPLRADDRTLAEQAPAAWRRLEALDPPEASVLLDVFLSWLLERHQGRTYEEIMHMFYVLTPLEETRAYQELVGIGEKKGRREGEAALLRRQLIRRFGALPAWAEARLAPASLEQLETWGDRVLDAATLTEGLGHPEH